MNKKLMILFALTLFSLMFVGGRAFAQMGWNTMNASTLIGYRVYSPNGAYELGEISNLVIGQSNGRVALVVLSNVPGFGSEHVAIPFESLGRHFRISFPQDIQTSYSGRELYSNPYDKTMAVGVVPSLMDSAWVDRVYRQYDRVPYWTERGEQPQMTLYKSSTWMGARVNLTQGATARVDDLVIDCSDGHIPFATLSKVSGWTGDVFAVPFNMLSRTGENAFALNMSKDKLVSEPSFTRYQEQGRRAYAEGVYKYFGVQPYWTE
jgi:sporulation protein YlmC with PRC-barrel domain